MVAKKRLLIDTDAGIDDAQAIAMALNSPEVEVVAITTCHGNTSMDNVCVNVLRILTVFDRLDIPVYRGCHKPLLGRSIPAEYHGHDGLGDVPDAQAPDVTRVQAEHAVWAIIRLINENKGELSLLSMAPSTNIATALRLDPELGQKLRDCYMMGGNYEGPGNQTLCAEFNFHVDPESASIVLKELGAPIYLITWDLCVKNTLSWEWYNKFYVPDNPRSKFLQKMEYNLLKTHYKNQAAYETADQLAMAVAIATDRITKATRVTSCDVETSGTHTRGMLLVDRRPSAYERDDGANNIHIILEADQAVYEELLERATK